jgi:hypothetical protein
MYILRRKNKKYVYIEEIFKFWPLKKIIFAPSNQALGPSCTK